jgi:hypothetical protein
MAYGHWTVASTARGPEVMFEVTPPRHHIARVNAAFSAIFEEINTLARRLCI